MAGSLKEENRLALFGVMIFNLVLYYTAVQTDSLMARDWVSLVTRIHEAIPASLGLILIGIINAQISAEAKCRIIFLRWSNSLPGCEAFSVHARSDARIELASLERAHGPFPTEPREQNALWYKLYKTVGDDPSVTQVHQAFLFARDYACLSLILIIVLGITGFFQIPSIRTTVIYLALLLLQFLLASRAARTNGRRFVTTVLALKAAGR